MNPARPPALHLALFLAALVLLGWSGWQPHDRFVWFLEVLPAIVGLAVLAAIHRHYRFTDLVTVLIFVHMAILMVGGHYTYAEMPLFNWLRDDFGLARNHYDRVGHVAQGFIPAMIAREILLRRAVLDSRGWLFFVVTCICLALSAFYELIEWWIAELSGTAAEAFLATQGDVWDTQWDMFLALSGAIAAQLILARAHDRALTRLAWAPAVAQARQPGT